MQGVLFFRNPAMEAFAVPHVALASANIANAKRTRRQFDDAVIEKLTDSARQVGATRAAMNYNLANHDTMSEETLRTWLRYWKANNHTYFTTTKRGKMTHILQAVDHRGTGSLFAFV